MTFTEKEFEFVTKIFCATLTAQALAVCTEAAKVFAPDEWDALLLKFDILADDAGT